MTGGETDPVEVEVKPEQEGWQGQGTGAWVKKQKSHGENNP